MARAKPVPPDPLPRFSPWRFRWFTTYLRRYFARHFNAVRVARDGRAPATSARPLVVVSNHPSWWDPILFLLLHRAAFDGRPAYGPIDAEMLRKYRLFERLGAFGVEQGTRRGAARFLRVGRAILDAPGSVLWITAEGRFRDPRTRPVRFAAGLGHLLRSANGVTVVPLAVEYPFWTERQPEVAVRFGDPIEVDRGDVRTAAGWTGLVERRLEATLDRLAEDTAAREPERFDVLVRGRAGVGLVYDLWRRLRARVTGTPYEAARLDRS